MIQPNFQHGLSYTEVLIAIALVALIAWPTAQSIQTSLAVAQQSVDDTTFRFAMLSLVETTLASDYASLEQRAGTQSAPILSEPLGANDTLDLYIAPWDIDNADFDDDPGTGVDDDVLWIRVALRNRPLSFETLVTR